MRIRRRGGASSDRDLVADALLSLAKGERLLAYARTADGGWVAGTNRALHMGADLVLGWNEIDQARWLDAERVLEIVPLPTGVEPMPIQRIAIPAPGLLPELVRERVTSNIVATERVAIAGSAGVRLVARRLPDGAGVRWSATYDPGVDSRDPAVQERVRAAIAELQSRLGV